MKEIVIVGGGPVGLWTAIQMKKRKSELKVTVYERHEKYQRNHVIRLDNWSMLLYGKNSNDKFEQEFIKDVTGFSKNQMVMKFAKTCFVRTNKLEEALKKYAAALNVDVVKKRITSPEDVEVLHPNCKHFIAADGAKSLMRMRLLGKEHLEFKELQNVIEMKFEVNNETQQSRDKDLTALMKFVALNYKNHFLSFDYIGKYNNGVTPITTRVFLDKETYDCIPEATFANPINLKALENEKCGKLYENIKSYLGFRCKEHSDKVNEDSIKITKLALSVYAANKFCIYKEDKDIGWFLTGDAALGVPYFRSLNSGMMLSSRLAQILCQKTLFVKGDSRELKKHLKLYTVHRPLHISTEFGIAYAKNMALSSYDQIRKKGGIKDNK